MKHFSPQEDGLLDEEQARHEMWTRPANRNGHINDLRTTMAVHLVRFDGRPDVENIVGFVRDVYQASGWPLAQDPLWLIGQIIKEREDAKRSVHHVSGNPKTGRDINVIDSLAETFVKVVVSHAT